MKAGLQWRLKEFLRSRGIVPLGDGKRVLREQAAEVLGIRLPTSVAAKDIRLLRAISGTWKPKRADFYDTDEWRALRYQALKLYGARCQCCGATPTPGNPMHVDHIKPRSKYPELELALSNLQILCRPCNLGKSNKDETDWRQSTVLEARQ